jgi:POT family proton-dependent oligopeptide transporter
MDVEAKPNSTHYFESAILFLFSKMLERAVYYGFRTLVVIYMIGEIMGMENNEALAIYGTFTAIIMFTPIIGGVLGDLIFGNRYVTIAGALLQALGAFAVCISSQPMLYLGIGLIALGSGLYGPNLFSQFGRVHHKNESKMDSGFTLYYLAINLGSFLGILFIGYLGEIDFRYGFVAAGILALLSLVLLLFPKKIIQETTKETEEISIPRRLIMILLAIFISSIFWGVYELSSSDIFSVSDKLRDTLSVDISFDLLYSVNSYAVVLLSIAGAILWWLWRLNRFIKLGLGCIVGGLSFAALLFMPEEGQVPGLVVFIISALLLGLAEILINPTIYSLLTKYTKPKYLALVFSVAFLPVGILYKLNSLLFDYTYDTASSGFLLKLSTFLLVATGIGIIVLGFIFLKKKPAS